MRAVLARTASTIAFAVSMHGGGAAAAGWLPAGPADGSYGVVTHPTLPGVAVLASTYAQGGIYVTRDGGATWVRAPGNLEYPVWPVGSSGVIWRSGPYKSTDDGRTWAPRDAGVGQLQVLGVNPSNADEVVAGRNGQLLHSKDGARSWNVETLPSELRQLAIDWSTRRVYAAFEQPFNGAFGRRALDAPGTWLVTGSAVEAVAADHGVVLVRDRDGGLQRSTDHGATFTPVGSELAPVFVYQFAFARAPSQRVYAIDTQSGRVLRSGDLGVTWTVSTTLTGIDYSYVVAVDAGDPERVYVGLAASNDGAQTFQPLARSSRAPGQFRTLWFDATDPNRMWLNGFQGSALLRTNDGGLSWSPVGGFGTVGVVGASRTRPNTLFAAQSTFAVSTDGGATWRTTVPAVGENSYYAAFAHGALAGQLFVADRYWTGTDYRYRIHASSDDGETFAPRSAPPIAVLAMAASPTDPQRIYAGGFEEGADGTSQLWGSVDGAQTWQKLATFPSRPPVFDFGGPCCSGVNAIAVDPSHPANVVVGLAQPPYVMRSEDGGSTWMRANRGLGIGDIRSIVFDPASPSTIFLSQWESGVYRSVDGGRTWSALDEGLDDEHVWQVAIDPRNAGRVYAASDEGLFRAEMANGAPSGHRRAIEFHHAPFDHYFVTADADEIEALDAGAFQGWQRTSEGFRVAEVDGVSNVPTCRFFGVGFTPLSSHFYTSYAGECESLKSNAAWQYERIAFGLAMPDAVDGGCPPGTRGLYRAWNQNQGGAPNHRFVADFNPFTWQLWQGGWQHEGRADSLVFACVPT